MRTVCARLAVTCHLQFWQSDRDIERATAVTRGWNGYPNKKEHRKLTLENNIVQQIRPGIKPVIFRLRVRHSTTELSPQRERERERFNNCGGSVDAILFLCNKNTTGTGSWPLSLTRLGELPSGPVVLGVALTTTLFYGLTPFKPGYFIRILSWLRRRHRLANLCVQ